MSAIPKMRPIVQQTVWVAKWEHKHGEDLAIHTTEEGARKQLVAWARGCVEEWTTPEELSFYNNLPDAHLIARWFEITGEAESLYVEDHLLYSADAWTA